MGFFLVLGQILVGLQLFFQLGDLLIRDTKELFRFHRLAPAGFTLATSAEIAEIARLILVLFFGYLQQVLLSLVFGGPTFGYLLFSFLHDLVLLFGDFLGPSGRYRRLLRFWLRLHFF